MASVDEKQCVMTKKSHSVESRGSRSRSRSASVEKHGHHQHQDGEKERRHGKSRHGHHGHHRHHHKKRSRSRSPPPLPPGHMGSDQKRRDREGREHKEKSGRRRSRSRDREPRDKDRDYKYRSKNKEDKYREPRDKEAQKERRGHRDRSLSRDRRRWATAMTNGTSCPGIFWPSIQFFVSFIYPFSSFNWKAWERTEVVPPVQTCCVRANLIAAMIHSFLMVSKYMNDINSSRSFHRGSRSISLQQRLFAVSHWLDGRWKSRSSSYHGEKNEFWWELKTTAQ